MLFMLSSYMSSPFCEKRSSIRLYSHLFRRGSNFIEILFVFIYVYFCQTRFLCHMMFVAFNSNTTGVVGRAGTAYRYHSGAPEFTTVFSGFVLLILYFFVQCFVGNCLSFFFWSLCCMSFF